MAADDAGNRRWGVWLVALSAGLTLAACGAAGRTGGAIGTSSSPTPSPVVPSASPTPSGPVTLGTLAALAERAAMPPATPASASPMRS
jgi:hypothetical protein